jgi:hypothetical protein
LAANPREKTSETIPQLIKMEPAFTYNTLDASKNEIRLLRVVLDSEDPISCTISTFSLDTPPPYDVLSYAWQERTVFTSEQLTTRETIIIDGAKTEVELNLAAFLRAARKLRWEQFFWIDAICINQADTLERNDQVLRMRDIYPAATRGIIWLGPESANSDLALELAGSFAKQKNDIETKSLNDSSHRRSSLSRTELDLEWILSTIRSGQYHQHWQAFQSLLDRSWWERIWTVQEVVLSRKPLVLCGSRSIEWSNLIRLAESILRNYDKISEELGAHGVNAFLDSTQTFELGKAVHRSQLLEWDSLDLLQVIGHTKMYLATNDQDKIYRTLGLAIDADRMVPRPNYSHSALQTYAQLLTSTIEQRGDLDVLAFTKKYSAPSFMPTFDVGFLNEINPAMSHKSVPLMDFAASKSYKPSFALSDDFSTLTLKGLFCGQN